MPSESASSWRDRRKQLREKRREEEDLSEEENELEALSEQLLKGPNKNRSYNDRSKKDNYVPHVSAAKRFKMEREAVFKSVTGEDMNAEEEMSSGQQRSAVAKERKKLAAMANAAPANSEEGNDQVDENIQEEEEESEEAAKSLLLQAAKLKQSMTEAEREQQAQRQEEQRILKEASKVQTNALQAASELAHGVTYTESLPTSWTVPRHILKQGEEQWNKIRNNWHILAEGHDIPPPMKSFVDMRFPKPIIDFLQKRNIKRPTPIQMQGLPVALAGRDMVGIAFTGSGKTMTFSLPLVMAALEEEVRMPLVGGEGPVGIILAPSRELVRQTYELVQNLCETLASAGFPQIRSQLVIGGENARDQLQPFRDHGVHCVVASPGRLRDFLKKKS